MYTHCPHCDTYFRITSEQLKRAHGEVRCGRCFGTFNALQHLIDEPPAKAGQSVAPPAGGAAPKAGDGSTTQRHHSQQLIEELQTQDGSSGAGKRLLWGLLALPLVLLLAAQYAFFNLDQLSQNPQLRPALTALCQVADCEVPLLRAPQQITLTERDIRSHPDTRDILLVQATMVNQAGFTQAFPVVELVLHDITGHTIAGRRFMPDEYLVDPSLDVDQGFRDNSSVTIVLELVDPGAEAVGFEFNFL
ncbi:hypothetical protein Tel_02605 [Candidatus Tenderia electrophaga]|jgi:predicted Zn finger-like uncharacterized protein|uniref:Zinc finger/thioredoxin putative domain-containing protein n=1 Tax=Candidatus Tenderia electrophaga TaxID=1748243 RepID=A0A0S2TAD5_9GAMM|nr:hypothetical protein Tel_02605 [Candidatus Tenderia electrophaga]